MTLKGWHITHQTAQAFKVTDFSDSAAALVGSTSGLGMITMVVSGTWKEGEALPPNEPQRFEFATNEASDSGVGFGEEVRQPTQEDRERRSFGVVRSIITIRYNKPTGLAD
jgi:hypothetical protein